MNDPILALAACIPEELGSEDRALEVLDRADAVTPPPPSRDVLASLPEKTGTVGLHRLLARSLDAEGKAAEADRIQLAIVERLNQASFWKAMVRAVRPLLEREPGHAGPLLARARARGGQEAVGDELLEEAHRRCPRHAHLAWQVAQARLERGEEEPGRRLAARVLPELIEDKDYDAAEGALLAVAEDRKLSTARSLCRSLELLARQEAWAPFTTVLEVGGDALAAESAAEISWPVVRDLWRTHPGRDDLREIATRVARAWVRRFPEPESVLKTSEIERPSQGAETVIERFRRAVRFPPGYYASHKGWGIGRILDNDTENLVIDFSAKPRHRMSYATAEGALDALPPRDLRVLLVHDREEALRLKKEDPPELIVLALETLKGGEGTLDAVRKILVPAVLDGPAWSGWWKAVKERVDADPRVDSRRAYQGIYRLRRPGEDDDEEVALPEWDAKRPAARNLAVLDTFLVQHPDSRERLLDAFRSAVLGVYEAASPEERAAAALWLNRWDPSSPARASEVMDAGFDFNAFGKAEQARLLEEAESPDALLAALNSRVAATRRAAWDRLEARGRLGETAERVFREAARYPEAALHILEEGLAHPGFPGPSPEGNVSLLLGLIELLDRPPRETHRKRARALVDHSCEAGRRLAAARVPDDLQGVLTSRLKAWQGSDTYRFPLLDFLREVGNVEIAEEVEGHRARRAAKLSNRMVQTEEDPYDGALLVTRTTHDRLQEERRKLGMELKTKIPQAIQKARELGDLSENAEYDAAKLKQANYAKRFQELEEFLNRARLIESIDRKPGTALPGTEVRLTAVDPGTTPAELRIWILGEGDQDLDPSVVSYRAPVGEALHGKGEGATVIVPGSGGEGTAYRIASIRERLP